MMIKTVRMNQLIWQKLLENKGKDQNLKNSNAEWADREEFVREEE